MHCGKGCWGAVVVGVVVGVVDVVGVTVGEVVEVGGILDYCVGVYVRVSSGIDIYISSLLRCA